MTEYRFRAGDAGELVLQLFERTNSPYDYEKGKWRDATVADIPVSNPFRQPQPDHFDPPIWPMNIGQGVAP